MKPLITKFKSSSTLYDSLGNSNDSYISITYDKRNICILKDVKGNIVVYNTITENTYNLKMYYPYDIYSLLNYDNVLYGFAGYDAKPFVDDTVLYVKDNNKLVQESYNKVAYVVHLSSSSEIRDFMIDEDYNYYVIHNKI